MKRLFLLIGLPAILAACSENSDCGVAPGDPNAPIGVNAAIAQVTQTQAMADTRTTITGSTAAWADGDVLGLFCAQATPGGAVNVPFTYAAGTSSWASSPLIYWADGTTSHKFVGYAPYASGNTSATAVKLPAISTQTGTLVPAQDFLYSKNLWTTGVTRTSSVALTFTHALSLVEFDVTVTGFASGTTLTNFVLASATASDKLYSSDANSTIDLTSGTITPSSGVTNTATITPASPPTLSATATKLYVLLLPGTFTAPTITFTLSEGGTSVSIPAASIVTTTFAAGTKYTYTVNISRTAITISTPTITPWTDGGTSTVNPSL